MTHLNRGAAKLLLKRLIADKEHDLAAALAPLDPKTTFDAWLNTFRAIEEFINLPGELDDPEIARALMNFPLGDIDSVFNRREALEQALRLQFDEDVVRRCIMTMVQAASIGHEFLQHGLLDAAMGFQTVGTAIGYFQSRRRHLLTLLYTIPRACKGTEQLERLDSISVLLALVETTSLGLTSSHQYLMLADVFPDFSLEIDAQDGSFEASHEFHALDALFSEPERASILEMLGSMDCSALSGKLAPLDPRFVFSAVEVGNQLLSIEAAYAEFRLHAKPEFASVAKLVRSLLVEFRHGYGLILSGTQLQKMAQDAGLSPAAVNCLVNDSDNYVENTCSYSPFIQVDDLVVSTVTLLSRFAYYWRGICLNRIRRFQIRAGFIFETSVKEALCKQGFTVTGVKRINRAEFDVVAVLDDVIYNVQCKNNLVDLNRIEADAKRFAGFNRRLDRAYGAALTKEVARENLLKQHLGLTAIKHFVVSRFPVATVNPRIISFGRIQDFRRVALAS